MKIQLKFVFRVYVISAYLLWVVLPVVFDSLWGADFGYARDANFEWVHFSVKLPCVVWWVFSPISLLIGLLLAPFFLSRIIVFPGISPCLGGYWDSFPVNRAIAGWLIAFIICIFVSWAICSCKRVFNFVGKQYSLSWCLIVFCCVVSLLASFFCKGNGPYGGNIENERKIVDLLRSNNGTAKLDGTKFGYRFVSDKLAVPFKYNRNNRSRTFCKVFVQVNSDTFPPQERIVIMMKDTEGVDESLPEVIPYKSQSGEYWWNYMSRLGWREYSFYRN